MNKKLISTALIIASLSTVNTAIARPEYVEFTGATDCIDCHGDNTGGGAWKPNVLDAYRSNGIMGLVDYIKTLADTAPVLSPIDKQWNVTVGDLPLTIPFSVYDQENDSFILSGSAPTGITLAPLRIDSRNNLPTIDLNWSPTAKQAGKSYTLNVYAQENASGRTLKSNAVKATIHVWSARVSATKNVSQFVLQTAKWSKDTLTLSGLVQFKASVTASQRSAALRSLTMNIETKDGVAIDSPITLTPNATGFWTKKLPLIDSQVPCTIKVTYEGLNALRSVQSAPVTCVK